MLVSVFRSGFSVQLIVVFIAGLVLWLPGFISPEVLSPATPLTPLYNKSVQLLEIWKFLPVIAGFICIYLIAFTSNNIFGKSDVMPKNNYFTALLVIILASRSNDLLIFYPVLPSALFVVFAMGSSLNAAVKDEPFNNAFLSGFYVAIAAMFYFPSFLFFLMILIGFVVSRLFSWRLWVLALLGFILPYMFLSIWYFWNDMFIEVAGFYIDYFKNIRFRSFYGVHSVWYYLYVASFLMIFLVSFLKALASLIEKNIAVRRALMWLIWFAVISCVGLFIEARNYTFHSLLVMIPSALFIENYIRSLKRKLKAELVFTIVLLFALIARFFL